MAGEDRIAILDGKIDAVRTDLYSFRTEVAKEIAALRTEMIERISNLKIWVLLTAAGAAESLISMLLNVASLLRGWKPW